MASQFTHQANGDGGNLIQMEVPGQDHEDGASTNPAGIAEVPKVPDDKETRRLQLYLRTYFYSAFKWTHNNRCSFHVFYCMIVLLQILKICLISKQLITFGQYRANFSFVVNRGHLTLQHLLLKDWDASWETLPYPPAHGEFATYDIKDMVDRINYAVEQYYNAADIGIGFFNRINKDTMTMTMTYFEFSGFSDSASDSDLTISKKTFPISEGLHGHRDSNSNHTTYSYNVMEEFEFQNITYPIKKLLALSLDFTLHSVRVYETVKLAHCLSVVGKVTFSDLDKNGQVLIDLQTLTSRVVCRDLQYNMDDLTIDYVSKSVGDVLIACCSFSLVVTVTIVIFAFCTFLKTKRYMKQYYQWYYKPVDPEEKDLPRSQYRRFINLWDLITVLADSLTLLGTVWIVRERPRTKWELSTLDSNTVVLGVGGIFAWFTLLRYFKFHNKFNLLFNTIYKASFDVIAYIICVTVWFSGFWLCGYVVMGPYNVKFQTLSKSAETLLSVVQGDELFFTLANLEEGKTGSSLVFWFSRIYICTFVLVFTVIVINLLIAIYMSAYESVKDHYSNLKEDTDFSSLKKALTNYRASNLAGRKYLRPIIMSNDGTMTDEEATLIRELTHIFRVRDLTEDTDFSSVKEALTNYRASSNSAGMNDLRAIIMSNDETLTDEEATLIRELMNICRVHDSNVIPQKPRTLKAFYQDTNDGNDKEKMCSYSCFLCCVTSPR